MPVAPRWSPSASAATSTTPPCPVQTLDPATGRHLASGAFATTPDAHRKMLDRLRRRASAFYPVFCTWVVSVPRRVPSAPVGAISGTGVPCWSTRTEWVSPAAKA